MHRYFTQDRVPAWMSRCSGLGNWIGGLLLCSAVVFPVGAQQAVSPPAQSTAPASAARQGVIAPEALLGMGFDVAQAIDGTRYRELWMTASQAVRAGVSDVDFVKGVTSMRRSVALPSKRLWMRLDVQRQTDQPDKGAPGGLYASCMFETQFGGVTRREIVSFRLDEDGQWRFAGYSLQ